MRLTAGFRPVSLVDGGRGEWKGEGSGEVERIKGDGMMNCPLNSCSTLRDVARN